MNRCWPKGRPELRGRLGSGFCVAVLFPPVGLIDGVVLRPPSTLSPPPVAITSIYFFLLLINNDEGSLVVLNPKLSSPWIAARIDGDTGQLVVLRLQNGMELVTFLLPRCRTSKLGFSRFTNFSAASKLR
jgi:hypothetical protein